MICINHSYKKLFLFIILVSIASVAFAQNKSDTASVTADSSVIKKHTHKKTLNKNKRKSPIEKSPLNFADSIANKQDAADDSDDSTLVIADTSINFKKIITLKIQDSIIRGDLAYPAYTVNKANILRTVVGKKALFSSAHFEGAVRLRNVKFFDEAQFVNARFDDVAKFEKTKFFKIARFKGAFFSQGASFESAKFFGDAKFDNSTFLQDADFRNTNFSGVTNFSYARFKRQCLMTSLETNENTEIRFRNTIFPDTIIFSYNFRNYKEIDFTTADFTDSCRFDYKADTVKPIHIFLYKTDISKLHLDYVHFKLLLPDSTINNLNRKKFISIDEKESMYEALLNNFKAHGQQESYKLCDIEYQTFRWQHSWAKWFVWLPRWWWNFGYDRQLIFSHTLLLVCIFTLITYFFIHHLNEEVYKFENITTDTRWQKKFSFNDFWNRLWYSFIYTATIFFKLTLQVDKVNFQKKVGTAYLILIYIIGLICLAYMANFVLQK